MNQNATPGDSARRKLPTSLLAGAATAIRRSFLMLFAACSFAATAGAQIDSVSVQVTPVNFVGYCPANLTLTMTITTPPKIPGNFRYRILGNNPLPHAVNSWGSAPAGTTFQIGFPFTITTSYTGTAIVQSFSLSDLQATQPIFQSPQANFSVRCLVRGPLLQVPRP